jgi:hypothetical protein
MEDRTAPGGNARAYQSSLHIRGSREEAACLTELRQRRGDEAVDRMLRDRELMRDPRPLTDGERAVIDAVLAPVLADLRAAGAIVPEVRYAATQDRGPDYVCAVIGPAGRAAGSRGVWAGLAQSAAERVAGLAEQVQEWEVEALAESGRPATWPQCPAHPASHPLEPAVSADGTATWRCPRSGLAVGAIGELGG